LLCIGDAAHAMSPVGGIGINLAIQDAVATYWQSPFAKARSVGTILRKYSVAAPSPHALRSACKRSSRSKIWRGLDKPQPARPPWPHGCWNALRSRAGCGRASSLLVSAPST
jgi:hypothetical protein